MRANRGANPGLTTRGLHPAARSPYFFKRSSRVIAPGSSVAPVDAQSSVSPADRAVAARDGERGHSSFR